MSDALKNSEVTSPAPSLSEAILFLANANVKDVLHQELTKAGITKILNGDNFKDCVEKMEFHEEAMLILDWEHRPEVLNNTLRAAQGAFSVDTRPIFLLVPKSSKEMIAVAGEYNVTRVHIGNISSDSVQEQLEALLRDVHDTSGIRAMLIQVADARAENNWAVASHLLTDLHKRFPDHRRVNCELAENLIQEDKWAKALALLESLSNTDAQSLRVQHLKARCHMKLGQYEEATEILQKTKLINPYNVDRLLDLGRALLHLDRTREALENFEAALVLDANNSQAQLGAGQCKLVAGDINEALQLMREVSGPRELASVFNDAAVMCTRQRRFETGLRLYHTAITMLGETEQLTSRLFFNMGIAYFKWERHKEALESFERALSLDHLYEKARHNAAITARRLGRQASPKVSDDLKISVPDDNETGGFTDDFENESI